MYKINVSTYLVLGEYLINSIIKSKVTKQIDSLVFSVLCLYLKSQKKVTNDVIGKNNSCEGLQIEEKRQKREELRREQLMQRLHKRCRWTS
jgi:hypothetical protein